MDGLVEVLGPGGFEAEALAGGGVGEDEAKGVEHLARGAIAGEFFEALAGAASVGVIADEGVTDVLEVDADLVGAAGMEVGLDEGGVVEALKDAVGGPGVTAFADAGGHAFAVGGVAGDGGADVAAEFGDFAAHDGVVDLFESAPGELGLELLVGGVIFGDDEAAAGIAVEAVDDAWAGDAADAAELAGAVVEEGVDEGMLVVADARVDDESGGFVEDEEVVVFEEDMEGDIFGLGAGRFGLGPRDGNGLAGAGGVGGFDGGAVDADIAVADEALEGAAGDGGEGVVEVGIEAELGDGFRDDHGVRVRGHGGGVRGGDGR